MPITAPQWRFTERMIEDAPDCRGVYVLWRGERPLAVGHASGGTDTIRSRLQAHLAHAQARDLPSISHYSWRICSNPQTDREQVAEQLGMRG